MKPASLEIISILKKAGHEAYWAGGCVRDILLGIEPKDFDIATSAKPDEIERLLEKTIPIGKQFGIIFTERDGHNFEIATFRSDSGYSDGRRPDAIEFSSAKADSFRRDFTINGMFYDPESDQVLDFVGGQKDLDARLIRFIGDAEIRIKEDHLRIIRAIRFKNSLNFQYHPATYTALSSNMELVNRVSAERIRQEFCKMIMCDNNLQALNDMEDLGLLKILFPEIQAMKGVAQPYQYHQEGDVWNHSLAVVGSLPKSASLNVRLAALLHDIGKAVTFEVKERIRFDGHAGKSAKLARDILERLKFSRKDIEHISWLISHHMMMVQLLEMNKGRQRHWFSHPWFRDLLVIFYADASGTRPKDLSLYEEIFEEYCRYKKELPEILPKLISGEEVMEILQIPAGKKLGEILESLYLAQLEGQIEDSSQARDWVLKNRSKFFK